MKRVEDQVLPLRSAEPPEEPVPEPSGDLELGLSDDVFAGDGPAGVAGPGVPAEEAPESQEAPAEEVPASPDVPVPAPDGPAAGTDSLEQVAPDGDAGFAVPNGDAGLAPPDEPAPDQAVAGEAPAAAPDDPTAPGPDPA